MKSIISKSLAIIAVLAVFTACKKEENNTGDTTTATGSAAILFEHVWGMTEEPFILNTDLVHPMNAETMNFSTFKYYVSNVKLKKADGTWWIHPESYFLVDASNDVSSVLNLGALPIGEYTQMEYTLGVDSIRNVSGAQSGALSTANNMFWSWNSGYIMVKAEGTSPQSSTGNFAFHLGGYKGTNNIVTVKTISFDAEKLIVSKGNTSQVHIKNNPAKLFHQDPLSSGTSTMMPGAKAKQMATNYYASFVFEHVHN